MLLGGDIEVATDLAPAARAMERALAAIYDAIDLREARLAATQSAEGDLHEAQLALFPERDYPAIGDAIEALASAQDHLTAAQAALASRPPEPARPAAPDLRASGDRPHLHQLDRSSLWPTISVPPPIDEEPAAAEEPLRPKTFEELHAAIDEMRQQAEQRRQAAEERAEELALDGPTTEPLPEGPTTERVLPKGFATELPPAIDELGFIHARTRDYLEEVAMIGMQRAPLLGDPWRTTLTLEHRMLRAIDALVAMGPPALAHLEPLVLDTPGKDPSRLFAVAMTLGCVQGRDALAVAERVFFDFERVDPDCAAQLAAALKLVPHDLLPLSLRTLLADPEPAHRALAIEVLGYRGLASEQQLVTAASDVPAVAAAALPYLARARSAATAEAIGRALGEEDGELRRSAWLAMALSGHRATRHALAEALDGEDGDHAALLLALVGDEHDGAELLRRAVAEPSSGRVTAVGWAGDSGAIGPLCELLEHEDELVAETAAYALDRITGANLIEEAEVEPEEIMVEEPPEPDLGEPKQVRLVRLVSDQRDEPPEPSPEIVERPTTDVSRWNEWLEAHAADFDGFAPGRRFRRGKAYTPEVSLWELDEARSTPSERRALGHELVIRTGELVRFDPHDFVVVQEAALAEWAPIAQRASAYPGRWIRP